MIATVVLVDTNVVSDRFKGDSRGGLYTRHLVGRTPAISIITVGELYRWTVQRRWGQQRVHLLRTALAQYLAVPPDDQTAWEWARVGSIPGRPMEAGDAWIAATALRHNVPLLSHNRVHFEHVPDLQLISEA